jgi:hypothetical protein
MTRATARRDGALVPLVLLVGYFAVAYGAIALALRAVARVMLILRLGKSGPLGEVSVNGAAQPSTAASRARMASSQTAWDRCSMSR